MATSGQGDSDYRPQIGETLFVSLVHSQPFRVTVTGYRDHHGEVFDYITSKGKKDYAWLQYAVFYPEIPAETPFIYIVTIEDRDACFGSGISEDGYFFDPQSAFSHLDALESGTVKPRCADYSPKSDISVRVERLK